MRQTAGGPLDFHAVFDEHLFGAAARALYGDSGFYNLGYWSETLEAVPENLPAACLALVQRHTAGDIGHVGAVLDVACGLGATTRHFERAYPEAAVTGLCVSRRQIAEAGKRCERATFLCADAARMGMPREGFDRIHCVEAAFYFDTRLDFLIRGHAALRPGGRLVLTDILFRRAAGLHVPRQSVGRTVDDYRRDIDMAGFRAVRFDDVTDRTIGPFVRMLAAAGYERWSRVIARGAATYLFVELRRKEDLPGNA